MRTRRDPLEPCGYCRRCSIHDDPGGCLTVEAYLRENKPRPLDELTNDQLLAHGHRYSTKELLAELNRIDDIIDDQPWNVHWSEDRQLEGVRYWLERESILEDITPP